MAFGQRGQGMTEYIIIVALIAVAAIGATSYFGSTVRNQVSAMAQSVAGHGALSQAATVSATAAAAQSTVSATTNKSLSTYNTQNND